ncbi:MAG: hypothetical protein M1474_01870 [Candidatus Marsarchaeota archaeon]|nr:hypothetical protein [Candidatus Marsarchaeota archaeon]
MAEKVLRFQNKGKKPSDVATQLAQKLSAEGYKVQSSNTPSGIVMQATKADIPRDLIAADRAFTILVAGNPNDFTVNIGIGKLMQNLGVMAAETLLLSGLFLAVDVPEMLWTKHVEEGIAKNVTEVVG